EQDEDHAPDRAEEEEIDDPEIDREGEDVEGQVPPEQRIEDAPLRVSKPREDRQRVRGVELQAGKPPAAEERDGDDPREYGATRDLLRDFDVPVLAAQLHRPETAKYDPESQEHERRGENSRRGAHAQVRAQASPVHR